MGLLSNIKNTVKAVSDIVKKKPKQSPYLTATAVPRAYFIRSLSDSIGDYTPARLLTFDNGFAPLNPKLALGESDCWIYRRSPVCKFGVYYGVFVRDHPYDEQKRAVFAVADGSVSLTDCYHDTQYGQCYGYCTFGWEDNLNIWVTLSSTCSHSCDCVSPDFCGSPEPGTSTSTTTTTTGEPSCVELYNEYVLTCNPTTSTTSTTTVEPTTTTAPPNYEFSAFRILPCGLKPVPPNDINCNSSTTTTTAYPCELATKCVVEAWPIGCLDYYNSCPDLFSELQNGYYWKYVQSCGRYTGGGNTFDILQHCVCQSSPSYPPMACETHQTDCGDARRCNPDLTCGALGFCHYACVGGQYVRYRTGDLWGTDLPVGEYFPCETCECCELELPTSCSPDCSTLQLPIALEGTCYPAEDCNCLPSVCKWQWHLPVADIWNKYESCGGNLCDCEYPVYNGTRVGQITQTCCNYIDTPPTTTTTTTTTTTAAPCTEQCIWTWLFNSWTKTRACTTGGNCDCPAPNFNGYNNQVFFTQCVDSATTSTTTTSTTTTTTGSPSICGDSSCRIIWTGSEWRVYSNECSFGCHCDNSNMPADGLYAGQLAYKPCGEGEELPSNQCNALCTFQYSGTHPTGTWNLLGGNPCSNGCACSAPTGIVGANLMTVQVGCA